MSNGYVKGLGLTLAMALAATQAGAATREPVREVKFRAVKERIPGQYVVVLREQALPDVQKLVGAQKTAAVSRLAQTLGKTYGTEPERVYAHALLGFSARLGETEARRLSEDERVAYVEEDGVARLAAERTTSVTEQPSGATYSLWGLDRIDRNANSPDSRFRYGARGTGVHAYVIDSGIDAHRDVAARTGSGYNATSHSSGVEDCIGHGTRVAATLGGDTFGVAPAVLLHPVRVFACSGESSNSVIIDGINWVAEHHDLPAVANLSMGGPTSWAKDDAVRGLIQRGVIVAVAAGNEGEDACDHSPSRVPAAITVGATDNSDVRADFSNWGSCVDLFAPGVSIASARYDTYEGIVEKSGTSMAAPYVAGAAALYLQTHRSATQSEVRDFLVDHATTGKISDLKGSPDRLLYTGDIDSWLTHETTPHGNTGTGWAFDTADWNGDFVTDLVSIKYNGTYNSTEVHILDGVSGFTQLGAQLATVLHPTDATWDFEVADWNGDGTLDLFAIKRQGTNSTEVHVLDGATGLGSFLGQYGTALHKTNADWEFDVGDWNRDGRPDLIAIQRRGGPSNTTEVHVLDGATGFSSFLLHSGSALGWVGPEFTLNMADWNRDGWLDLVAVNRTGASHSTEVHVLSGAVGFSHYILNAGTTLHQTDGTWDFKLAYRDEEWFDWVFGLGNGLDLVGIKRSGTPSGQTEVHILNP